MGHTKKIYTLLNYFNNTHHLILFSSIFVCAPCLVILFLKTNFLLRVIVILDTKYIFWLFLSLLNNAIYLNNCNHPILFQLLLLHVAVINCTLKIYIVSWTNWSFSISNILCLFDISNNIKYIKNSTLVVAYYSLSLF